MTNGISGLLSKINFFDLIKVLYDKSYYEIVFPFLLSYAIFFTILSKIKIFKSKKTGEPIKPIIIIIALIISFFGVTFETAQGYNVGKLLMMMFPNISALTIGILALYIIGAILGKDFFRGVFRKDWDAYVYMAVGTIGFGAIIYYVGIAMGFWSSGGFSSTSYWNVIIAVALLILGLIFLFSDMFAFGLLCIIVFIAFVLNAGKGSILEYFIDPVVFIFFIFIFIFSWITTGGEKEKLEKKIARQEEKLSKYAPGTKDYDSRFKDILEESLKRNREKLKKLWEWNFTSCDKYL